MGFYSLQIARTGLVASQKALDVISHNISNANTKGYTRQRLDLSSIKGTLSDKITVGAGVQIEDLKQIRNEYLDFQFRGENSVRSELQTKSENLTYIENIIGEPSDYGINQSLADFFVSLEELTYNAQEESYRETVVQNAVKLTDSIRTIAKEMIEYQKESDNTLEMSAKEINGYLDRIKDLNETIYSYELKGSTANDLRDERNLLVDELSKYIDIEAFENSRGRLEINAAGTSILGDTFVRKIEVKPDKLNSFNGEMLNNIYWKNTTSKVNPTSGKLKGLIDTIDGASQEKQGIPYYMNQLNLLAKGLVERFNDINNEGWTIPYGEDPSTNSRQGINFFDEDNTEALNIKVSADLIESGFNIALSKDEITGSLNWGNSENGLDFIKLRDNNNITVDGKIIGNYEEFFQKTIADMAINKNYYDSRLKSQQELTEFVDSQRLAISEVSIDEEMVNMVQFQHSYNASAKVITVVDEMLDTLMGMIR